MIFNNISFYFNEANEGLGGGGGIFFPAIYQCAIA